MCKEENVSRFPDLHESTFNNERNYVISEVWDLLRIIKTKLVENTYNGVLLLSVFLNILIQRLKTSFILNMF